MVWRDFWVVLGSCSGKIWIPLTGFSGSGLVCGLLCVGGSFMAGSGFTLHGFSLYFSVMKYLFVLCGVV